MYWLRFLTCLWMAFFLVNSACAVNNGNAAKMIQCLKLRQDPKLPSSSPFLSLPFYQPLVDGSSIDSVVTDVGIPSDNAYTLHDSWRIVSSSSLIPIVHWRMSEYTGLSMADLISGQRAHIDAYGKSGEQMIGRWAGFWMNTQNDATPLANGSLSANLGCWYQEPPYAKLFSNASQILDVSFDTGVNYIGAGPGAHSQAYFQLIVTDTSGGCGNDCAFSISVGYAGPDINGAVKEETIPDGTGTTELPLVNAGLDAPHWITRMSDSMHFQVGTFSPSKVHFRLAPEQLIMMRNDVASKFPKYQALSKNPIEYSVKLINVNGEVYDPCKAGAEKCGDVSYSQLGMVVGNIRVAAFTPHEAMGKPSLLDKNIPIVVFRDGSGNIYGLSATLNSLGPVLMQVGTSLAMADPSAINSQGVRRIYFLGSNHHIFEAFNANGSWQIWDMSVALGFPDAFSAPRAYAATDGSVRVYFRDIIGHVYEARLNSAGWMKSDLTALVGANNLPAALGSPAGYQTGDTDRVIYRAVGDQIIEIFFWGGRWQAWNMTATPGASSSVEDPFPFVDKNGSARVIYRDINGAIHQLLQGSAGWQDTSSKNTPGVVAALGSPSGCMVGDETKLLYQGVDHHVHLLTLTDGQWVSEDMNLIDGAVPVNSDPFGYTDADGIYRVDYVGIDSQLHEFFWQGSWLHRDL
ncbi:hypothetical protein [Xanthomonas sp. GPE 39]|uniref:hypothetical protein n=1 Tax=Xanthomonas sp. GPE 39 TaxID=1583099 RepID=UPI000B1BF1B5|nr:hypothetical protein [Xanthomonas sp. GPE 39]